MNIRNFFRSLTRKKQAEAIKSKPEKKDIRPNNNWMNGSNSLGYSYPSSSDYVSDSPRRYDDSSYGLPTFGFGSSSDSYSDNSSSNSSDSSGFDFGGGDGGGGGASGSWD